MHWLGTIAYQRLPIAEGVTRVTDLCAPVGRSIAGRQPGVHLNKVGRQQAKQLAARLHALPLHGIYSSPLERAVETAEPVAAAKPLDLFQRLEISPASISVLNITDEGTRLLLLNSTEGWHGRPGAQA